MSLICGEPFATNTRFSACDASRHGGVSSRSASAGAARVQQTRELARVLVCSYEPLGVHVCARVRVRGCVRVCVCRCACACV
eukprot:5222874-Pleurochrysis_carterae.AAC.1